jgi:hypothetical protein
LITAILLVTVLAVGVFAGCESYKNTKFEMDSVSVPALSNGGSVVYHGDYIYFINGYSGYLDGFKENWFGNVLKGAILRIKKSDVSDMSKAEVIVPKSVISDSENRGFSIYGEYIYYTSSSATETKSGTVDTSELQFMRTRLDGQNTAIILKIANGLSTTYKYTPAGLVYLSDGTLYFKSTSGKLNSKKKGDVIAEKVSAVHFPVSQTYDPSKGYAVADHFFYTKASEETGNYTNQLYVASADGKVNKKIIDQFTYTKTPATDSKNAFSISVVASKDEGSALTLLYKKSYYLGTSSSAIVDGMYMYKFDNSSFNFDPAKEIKLTATNISAAYVVSYDQGFLATSGTLTLYSYDFTTASANAPVVFADKTATNKISSATVIGVDQGYVYYYNSDPKVYRYKMDGSANVEYIGSNKMKTDFIAPELVAADDATYVYYFNTDKGDYLYRLNASGYDRKESKSDDILFGIMTSEDAAKYAEKK